MPIITISAGTAIGGTVYSGVEDTQLREVAPTTNYSSSNTAQITHWASNDQVRSYFKFTGLSNVTGPGTVSGAKLGLYYQYSPGGAQVTQTNIHQLIVPVNAAQATWNERQTGVAWASGALTAASVDMTPVVTAGPFSINQFHELSGAGLDALVSAWINGTQANHGIILSRLGPNIEQSSTVWTSEYVTAALRPYLTFNWTPGTPVNWTIGSPTVNSDAGTVSVPVTLDGPAPVGGLNGLVNTYDIVAVAGVNYTAQVAVPFSIGAGLTSGNIVIPILP